MIIDWTSDDIYQHQNYCGLGLILNWSSEALAVLAVALSLIAHSSALHLKPHSADLTLQAHSSDLHLKGE